MAALNSLRTEVAEVESYGTAWQLRCSSTGAPARVLRSRRGRAARARADYSLQLCLHCGSLLCRAAAERLVPLPAGLAQGGTPLPVYSRAIAGLLAFVALADPLIRPATCEAVGSGTVYRLAASCAALPLQPTIERAVATLGRLPREQQRPVGVGLGRVAVTALQALQGMLAVATSGGERQYAKAIAATLCRPDKVRAQLEAALMACFWAHVAGALAGARLGPAVRRALRGTHSVLRTVGARLACLLAGACTWLYIGVSPVMA